MQSNQQQLELAARLLARFPERKPEQWLASHSEAYRLAGVLLLRRGRR